MPAELRATYRVQLHAGFGFTDAVAIADYLAELGVSHLYSSPILQAAPGSTHGYDVVNPRRVNEELGGEAGHGRLRAALAGHGLGHVLDIVPNHMAIGGRENAWWWDVLENGQASRYARYFDVDWNPPEARVREAVLMPILGQRYGQALAAGQIRLVRADGAFTISYFDHVLPVAPRSLDRLLGDAARRLREELQRAAGVRSLDDLPDEERRLYDELAFLADACGSLSPASATDTESVARRHRDKEVLRELLADLCRREERVVQAIDEVVGEINADAGRLDELLQGQNYRLTFWRAAERELDYRRFFDINTLVGMRVEDEHVFDDTHALVLRWLKEGVLDGVRIDHVDGLRDPETYLHRLRASAPDAWIVVEKILEPGESLPASWPVAGTTGYDFLNLAGGLFVDPAGEKPLTELYVSFTQQTADYRDLVHDTKLQMLRESLGSDVNRLTALWLEVCQQHRRSRDYTHHELQEALREVIACFPVYRTYVEARLGRTLRAEDAHVIGEAIEAARARRPDLEGDLFAFLGDLLALRVRGERQPASERQPEAELVMRFQQLTGPAMAKGVEDTAFYRYNRLVALNEVGGNPARFGVSVAQFHAACAEAQQSWPKTMLDSSTHDTKRGEDARARISLLSEMPEPWAATVWKWADHNDRYRRGDLPDRNAEYLYYQTLVGAWPLSVERAAAYMEKAAREAKQHTSWTNGNPEYEAAFKAFVERTLGDEKFVDEIRRFVAELATPGWITSLAQTLLKLTAPGVPDIYQGSELWNLSLVDPDNRRPVDYAVRRRLLGELREASPETIWDRREEGLPKLWTIRQTLALRRERPDLFGPESTYQPLSACGTRAGHVVAFARGGAAVTVVPRLVLGLGGDWADTAVELPRGIWRNVLAGERHKVTASGGGSAGVGQLAVGQLLRRFPVALLIREV